MPPLVFRLTCRLFRLCALVAGDLLLLITEPAQASAEAEKSVLVLIKLGCRGDSWLAICCATFEFTAVRQIRGDAGRAEGMIANPRFNAGRFRAPPDDAVGVLLKEGIGGKLASLAAGGAEEIAVDVVGDVGRFDIIVQTLVEMMMTGNVVLLAAFFV